MAKSKTNVLDDDFDLDTEFDDMDLDFPDPFAIDDRQPSLRIASGAILGAKEAVTSTGFIKDSIKTIFPPTYGQAIDLADRVGMSAKSLYDESVAKIKPTLKQAKNAVLKVVPPGSKYIPKQMQDVFDRWKKEKEEEVQDTGPQELSREGILSATLNDMFQIQMATNVENHKLDEGRQNLKDGMESVRYQSTLDAANRTAISTGRLENYQSTIGLNFQKKNLELTYRLLFAAQDSHKYAQEDSVKRDELLSAIAKNTTLPEFVKIKDSEARAQAYKTKLFDSINNGLFADRNAYIEKTLGGITKKVNDSLLGFVQGAQEGLSETQMGLDQAEGVDKAKLGGQIAGDFGARKAGQIGSSWLRDKLKDSKLDKKFGISEKGEKIGTFLENAPNKINEFRKDKKYSEGDGITNKFMSMLQAILPGMGMDTATIAQTGKDMDSPFHLTRRSDRSINEVIPGFLARIYREIQVLRTGNKKIGLTKFSQDGGRFTSEEKLAAEIIDKVAPKAKIARVQKDLDAVLKKIDPSGKKLSEEAKGVLKERLLTNSADRNLGNKERLGNYSSYQNEKDSVVAEIVPVMRAYFEQMTSGEEKEFSKAHNALADGIVDPREYIQQQLDLGNYSQLRKLGLVDKTGTAIQTSEIIQTYLKKQKPSSVKEPVQATNSANKAFSSMADHLAPKASVKDSMSGFAGKATSSFAKLFSNEEEEEEEETPGSDVYVAGQKTPILTAVQIASGKFFNQASGVAIQAIADISGSVIDARGRTVIAKDDSEKLVYYRPETKTFEKIQELGSKVKAALEPIKEKANSLLGKVKEAAVSNFKPSELDSAMDVFSKPLPPTLAKGYEKTKEGTSGLVDVYVDGGTSPRITKAQFEAGELRDAVTNKVITSAEMITGAVIDKFNKVRVTKEEAQALGYFNDTKKTFEPLSALSNKVQSVASSITSSGNTAISAMITNGVTAFKSEVGLNPTAANDVYVEGDGGNLPRLTAIGFTNGEYTDAITGAVLKTEKDIDGPVQGPGAKLVLTEIDLPKLKVFDITLRKWSPLWIGKKVFEKLWHFQTKVAPGMAARNLGRLWKATKWAARAVGSALGMTARSLGVGRLPKDVYVQGEEYPRLVGYKFTQGEYVDRETGKPISNETEITGTVIDKTGAIVIDESDLDKLYTKDKFLSKYNPLKLLGLLAKGAKATVKWGYETAKKNLTALGSFAVSAGSKAVKATLTVLGLRMAAQDVFVNGQKEAVLIGKDMQAGKYFSVKTKKPILSPNDIDGEVTDAEGQIVVTKQNLASGLKTISGKTIPIKSLFKRVVGATFGTLGKVFNPNVKTKLNVNRKTSSKTAVTDSESATIKSATTLDQILQTIKTMGQKPKGIRSGSYADEVSKDKAEDEETLKRKKEAAEKADKKNPKNLLSKAKEEEGDGLLGKGIKAIAGRVLGGLGLGSLIGGGAAAATTVAAGTAATAATAGTVAAGTAAVAGTAAAAGTVAAGAGTAAVAGGVAAAIGGGLLAFITAPVTLAAAAVALSGYAAYKGFQYLTRGTVGSLQKVRMAQYGANPENTDFVKRIVDLEGYLSDFLIKSPTGYSINDKKISAEKTMGYFDLNYLKEHERNLFFGWYQKRFKPVFLTHVTAMSSLTRDPDLDGVADLKNAEQSRYLEAVKFPNGPYTYVTLPTLDQKLQAANAETVDKYVVAAQEALLKAKEEETKDKDKTKDDKTKVPKPIPPVPVPAEVPAKAPLTAAVEPPKPNSLAQQAANTVPDAEPKVEVTPTGDLSEKSAGSSSSNSGLTMAAGAPIEGLAHSAFLKVSKNAKFEQINPAMREQLVGMAEEYGKLTGKAFDVTNAFRSYDDQMAMKKKYGARAAAPGKSLHEFGIALDVPSATMNEVDKLGLARKYGFTRPVGAEPWHVEPIGVQDNIDAYKKDPNLAAQAIKAGVGLGGGGIGSVAGSKPYSRNIKDSAAIMAAAVKPTETEEVVSGSAAALTPKESSKGTSLANAVTPAITNPASVASAKSQLPVDAGIDGVKETVVASGNDKPAAMDKAMGAVPQKPALAAISKTPLYAAPSKPPLDEKNSTPSNAKPTIKDQVNASSEAMAKLPADPSLKVPLPVDAGIDGVKETIVASSKMVGVDPNEMLLNAAIESAFNPNAAAKTSSAKGLFQFLDGTWKEQLGKHGSKYGFDNSTPATDPRAASIMAAHMLKSSKETLSKRTTRPIGATEGYLAHFLGTGGAGSFLKTLETTPNAPAASGMQEAAKANQAIFYDKGQPRSYSGVYALMNNKLVSKAKAFGINLPTSVVPEGKPQDNQNTATGPGLDFGQPGQNTPVGANKPPVAGVATPGASPAAAVSARAETANLDLIPNSFPKQAPPAGGMPGVTPGDVSTNPAAPSAIRAKIAPMIGMPETTTAPTSTSTDTGSTAQAMTRNAPSVPNGAMAPAYGFNMPNTAPPMRASADAGLSKSLMANTEGLLTQQLAVQTQMLELMNKMFGLSVNKSKQDSDNAQSKQVAPAQGPAEQKQSEGMNSYSPPKPPVSMKRVVTI